MPRKTLFSAPVGTLLKDENVSNAKKEIHNTIQNSNTNTNNNEFIKKMDSRKPEPEEIIIEDDNDDWSAVPAFLRRKKN